MDLSYTALRNQRYDRLETRSALAAWNRGDLEDGMEVVHLLLPIARKWCYAVSGKAAPDFVDDYISKVAYEYYIMLQQYKGRDIRLLLYLSGLIAKRAARTTINTAFRITRVPRRMTLPDDAGREEGSLNTAELRILLGELPEAARRAMRRTGRIRGVVPNAAADYVLTQLFRRCHPTAEMVRRIWKLPNPSFIVDWVTVFFRKFLLRNLTGSFSNLRHEFAIAI